MIEVMNLSKIIDKKNILKDICLTIEKGVTFALLGPNGSGKSTLLKCLLGISYSTDGKIRLNQIERSLNQNNFNFIGYMPQNPFFPENLSVSDVLYFLESISGRTAIYKDKLAVDLGISSFLDKKINQLSQGMKQKVNVLQCFMSENLIYILDEPSVSLDPDVSFYLKSLINIKKKEGATIILTSHIMSEIENLIDKVGILIGGEIFTVDTPTNLIKNSDSLNLEDAIRKIWMRR